MKARFMAVFNRLKTSPTLKYIAKNSGQIDKYIDRPNVKFPCALISISLPKRKNMTKDTQMCGCLITIRVATDKLWDINDILDESRFNIAMQHFDTVEEVESLLQGFKHSDMDALECISCVDEERPDMDITRFVFSTNFIKEIQLTP